MSFTDEKIKVLNGLLSRYSFSDGFTFYWFANEVSDKGVSSRHSVILSGHDPRIKNELSGAGNFALFPIVFDYFDAILDKKMSINNKKFFEKKSIFINFNRDDEVIDFLEKNVLSNAVELRNKIIHNDLTVNEENGLISLPNGEKYKIANFDILNRLVFNVASRCLNNKNYSMYEKSAALSLYKTVFGESQSDVISSLYKKAGLVEMEICARIYSDYTKKTISSTDPLFEILSENVEYKSKETGETEFKKGVYGNRTFKFILNDSNVIIPAELIISNKNITLNDIGDWGI